MSQHTSIELVKVYFYISEKRLQLISPIYCRSLLWNVDCESKYSLRCWLQSSPCPRRPPPPLVLPIVALGGGVGEGGEPGAHQTRHHLPIVVVVASWERSSWDVYTKQSEEWSIPYRQMRICVSIQLTSLSRQNWNIWRLLGLVEGLAWKALQHVGWDPRAAVLRLWGEKAIEIDEFLVQLSPLPQWMLAGDIWEESESQPCWLWQASKSKEWSSSRKLGSWSRQQLTNTRSNEKQVEAATAVGGGWWVGSQVVGVAVRNQFSWDADYVIRRNNPFMPFGNSRKL